MRYRDANRKREPKKGADLPGRGSPAAGAPDKSVGFPKPDGATQPRSRSLGVTEVKTSVDKKGL